MPRPAIAYVQNDFSAGQVTANAARSDDVKLVKKGLKQATNCRLLSPRGFAPRFGRDVIYNEEGRTETVRFGVGLEYRITFGDGTVTIRDKATGEIVFEEDGYPWALATLEQIVWASLDREIVVCFPDSAPYVINYRAAVSTQISYGAGTVFAGASFSRTANAFLGLTTQSVTTCAFGTGVGPHYIGKSFSTPRTIGQCIVFPSSDNGFESSFSVIWSITLSLYAKQGAAPTSSTDGTLLATVGPFAETTSSKTLTSSDTTTEFDHVWLVISAQNQGVAISDIAFFTGAGAEAWASNPFEFAQNAIDAVRQPYYKYAQPAVTLAPSALSGVGITGTFSAPVLTADHVGVSFRYGFRELVCTAYTSPTQGTFTVIEDLPPTHNVTVGSTAGFRIGDIAIGASSDCQALILDITSATVMKCVYLKRFAGFTSSEKIATETAVTTFSSTSATTHAAIKVWDEAAMSDVRGWPRSVSQDRNRIIFCDLPLLANAVAWSAIGLYNDFLPAAGETDAIFEYAPNNVRVLHVSGGPDEIVFTAAGVFYIPISETNPLIPGSVVFRKIGSLAAGTVKPVEMDQGIVFGAAGGNGIMAVLPTGQQTQPWELRDISRFHAGLISGLRCLAVQAGTDDTAEQYLWAVNADGTAVSGRFDPDNQWIGFVPVEGTGEIGWISAYGSEVILNVTYELDAGSAAVVERINEDRYIDACIDINDPDALLAGDPGTGPLWMFAGLTADVMKGRKYYGQREIDENGDLVELFGDDFSAAGFVAGFGFTATAKQYLPNIDEGQARGQRITRRKIKKAGIHVRDATEFALMGRSFAGYRASDPGEDDPPLWDSFFHARSRGRSHDPETVFEKSVPGPCTVLEMSGEVTV
jgi:hypothetical protein